MPNETVAAACAQYPDVFTGLGSVDPHKGAAAVAEVANIAGLGLRGVKFRPCSFTPTWDKHKGARCHGVQIHIADPRALEPLRLGVACIVHARAQDFGKFRWRTEKYEFVEDKPAIDLLTGSARFRAEVEKGAGTAALCAAWDSERAEFLKRRQGALSYE